MLYPGDLIPGRAGPATATVLTADAIYHGQKLKLNETIHRVLATASPRDGDVQAIVRLLHNLAGTALHFGEGDVGECALHFELRLRHANSVEVIKDLCSQIRRALD